MKVSMILVFVPFTAAIVAVSYFLNFYVFNDYTEFSSDTAVWGQLGDYLGGVLNPFLSFITIVLLIKTLGLQHEELSEVRHREKIRTFESKFYNMVSVQQESFNQFELKRILYKREKVYTKGDAVIRIEDFIEDSRDLGFDDVYIVNKISEFDRNDKIYNVVRAFYATVKVVEESLNDKSGFSASERQNYIKILINFTDFSAIRLILISMQFCTAYPAVQYLRESFDFNKVLDSLGLSYDQY